MNSEVGYLANLCHDCRGCYFACPFSPPHEFLLNLPQAFSLVRAETYEEYAWPRGLGGVFRRNGMVVGLVAAASIAVVLGLTARLQSAANLYRAADAPGTFYAVIPEWAMVGIATLTFLFALLAQSIGFVNFWRDTGGGAVLQQRSLWKALGDVLTLRNLGGGGHGCNDRDETFSHARQIAHQTMFYGFALCFASTCTAGGLQHVFGRGSRIRF